jgi:NADH-quinone oxidoreductase subunit E
MSEKLIRQFVTAAGLKEIDKWVEKYPKHEAQSAVMSALMILQEENGCLTKEMMDAVAEYLKMPAIAVYEVSTFYTMYEHKPIGKHLVNVCTNISCKLRGSALIVESLEKKLGIKLGETSEDGRFTLRSVECLGACVNAPMMQVDKNYHENLTADNIDAVLDQYQ